MPFTLDLPPTATGQSARAAQLNFGEPTHYVSRREELLDERFFNTHPTKVSVVQDRIDRLLAQGQRKVEDVAPLITKRVAEAKAEGYLLVLSPVLTDAMGIIATVVAPNPMFSTISFDVLRDGGLELVFTSDDRQQIDFFTFYWDEEDQDLEIVLNRVREGNKLNVFGSLQYILQQIRENP